MATAAGQSKKRPLISRRAWFRLHGYFSLPIWLLFCFVCLTGTIAVVSHEITWLLNPAARAENPGSLPRQPVAALVDAVTTAVPGAQVSYVAAMEPYLVSAVGYSLPGQPPGLAYVNPYTAQVQETNNGITFVTFMRSLHGWLLAPWQHAWSVGYYLVSAMAIVVLGALVTGLVVYRKFWRAWSRPRIRWRADARTLLGDLHRHAGAWSLWFLLVIGMTGGWYLLQAVLWHNAIDYEQEVAPLAITALPAVPAGATPGWIGLAEAERLARAALPAMDVAWLSPPEHNRDYYRVYGGGDLPMFDRYAWRAEIDPWRGEVVRVQTPASMNVAELVAHLADPLHFGNFGGLWTKMLWFLSGLLLTGLSITGFMIWSRRVVQEARGGRRAGAEPVARNVRRWPYGLSGLLLLLPCWFFYQSLHPVFPPEWPEQQAGPFRVAVTPADDGAPYHYDGQSLKDFSARFCDGCVAQLRQAWFSSGAQPSPLPDDLSGLLHGDSFTQHAHAPFPRQPRAGDRLWLTLEDWQGGRHELSWPLTTTDH